MKNISMKKTTIEIPAKKKKNWSKMAMIGSIVMTSQTGLIQYAQAESVLEPTVIRVSNNTTDPVALFYDKGYTYCDAKILGAYLGVNPWQGKLQGGQKILAHNYNLYFLNAQMRRARRHARKNGISCGVKLSPAAVFYKNGYSYCDAKILGAYLRVSISQAKIRGGQKILLHNGRRFLNGQMRRARKYAHRRGISCDLGLKDNRNEKEIQRIVEKQTPSFSKDAKELLTFWNKPITG